MSTATATLSSGRRRVDGGLAWCVCCSYALLWAATLAPALVAAPFAGGLHRLLGLQLDPRRGPAVAVAILLANTREALIPFLCALAVRRGWLRRLTDVIVAGCLGGNAVLAGLALAARGPVLFVQLPHWPVEWTAFALALSAYRRARAGRTELVELLGLALACGVLLCLAAVIETYTVPAG